MILIHSADDDEDKVKNDIEHDDDNDKSVADNEQVLAKFCLNNIPDNFMVMKQKQENMKTWQKNCMIGIYYHNYATLYIQGLIFVKSFHFRLKLYCIWLV